MLNTTYLKKRDVLHIELDPFELFSTCLRTIMPQQAQYNRRHFQHDYALVLSVILKHTRRSIMSKRTQHTLPLKLRQYERSFMR